MTARRCIVVMAKEPAAGRTKTRLAAALGDVYAATLYEAFLLDTLATCRDLEADLLISYTPTSAGAQRFFRRAAPHAMLAPQVNTGFGERLSHAMQGAFDRGFERVAVIGSDIPHMHGSWIAGAFEALDAHDVALGPTVDGGYYLLALRVARPQLFVDIDWSSGRELRQTIARIAELGLDVAAIPETFDIDEPNDLVSLRTLVAEHGDGVCPRTAAAIARLDLGAPVTTTAARQ